MARAEGGVEGQRMDPLPLHFEEAPPPQPPTMLGRMPSDVWNRGISVGLRSYVPLVSDIPSPGFCLEITSVSALDRHKVTESTAYLISIDCQITPEHLWLLQGLLILIIILLYVSRGNHDRQ